MVDHFHAGTVFQAAEALHHHGLSFADAGKDLVAVTQVAAQGNRRHAHGLAIIGKGEDEALSGTFLFVETLIRQDHATVHAVPDGNAGVHTRPEDAVCSALRQIHVRGRIEMVKVSDDFTLMIDYAHNAMALESLLRTLREYEAGRLVCVFGCGGNRARSRRFEMGEVSGRLADLTVITSDNPRFEEPMDIIKDIVTGITPTGGAYVEIPDRKEAIRYVIENGLPGYWKKGKNKRLRRTGSNRSDQKPDILFALIYS